MAREKYRFLRHALLSQLVMFNGLDAALGGDSGGTPPGGGGGGTPPADGGTPPGGGGTPPAGDPKPWYDGIEEPGVVDLIKAKGFDSDPKKLASSYFNANKALSGAKDVVAVPAADAPKEAWDKFYGTMRPESADAYEFKFAEGFQPDEKFLPFAKEMFHANGLTPKQAAGMVEMWEAFATKRVTEERAAQRQALEEFNTTKIAELKSGFGAEWDSASAKGREVYQGLGLTDDAKAWIDANQGSPYVAELIAKIGSKMKGEGGLQQGGGNSNEPNDAAGAMAEISRLRGDAEFTAKYTDAKHPEHKAAVDKMDALYAKAYPKR